MISKVKAISGCSLACLASLVMANNVLVNQNFDSGFQPGILKGTVKNAGCTYTVHHDTGSMEIVNGGKSSPYALKVGRKAGPGFIILNSAKPVPRGNDFRVSFDVRFAPKNHVTVFIGGKNQPPLGAINISDMSILRGYNENKLWVNSGLAPLPQDQWIRVSVNFKGSMKTYDVSVTYPDGSVKTGGRDFPFLNEANVSDIRFINAPPVGSSYLIDNVTLEDLGKNAAPKIENGVVLDGTMGTGPVGGYFGHMGFAENKLLKEKLIEMGVADKSTAFVVTHITHNQARTHEDVEEIFAGSGIDVAYDGYELEI